MGSVAAERISRCRSAGLKGPLRAIGEVAANRAGNFPPESAEDSSSNRWMCWYHASCDTPIDGDRCAEGMGVDLSRRRTCCRGDAASRREVVRRSEDSISVVTGAGDAVITDQVVTMTLEDGNHSPSTREEIGEKPFIRVALVLAYYNFDFVTDHASPLL